MAHVKGDRVEIVVELGGGETRTYEIEATRAGRRVETTTGRGVIAVVEHPSEDDDRPSPPSNQPALDL